MLRNSNKIEFYTLDSLDDYTDYEPCLTEDDSDAGYYCDDVDIIEGSYSYISTDWYYGRFYEDSLQRESVDFVDEMGKEIIDSYQNAMIFSLDILKKSFVAEWEKTVNNAFNNLEEDLEKEGVSYNDTYEIEVPQFEDLWGKANYNFFQSSMGGL